MATHDLFRAKEVGDRIGIMKGGRLVENLAAASLSHAQLERIYLDHMRADRQRRRCRMIGAIVDKELTELRRDGRVLAHRSA